MTARERLVALRRLLLAVVTLRALLVGAAVAVTGVALGRMLSLPGQAQLLVASVGVVVAALLASRAPTARSLPRVALWVEERHPSLQYALVTSAEGSASEQVERQATATPWWDTERRRLWRALLVPAVAFLVALILLGAPSLRVGARAIDHASEVAAPARGRVSDPLATIVVTVQALAYTGRGTSTQRDPSSIEALVGSRLLVTGMGEGALVRASLDSTTARCASSVQ